MKRRILPGVFHSIAIGLLAPVDASGFLWITSSEATTQSGNQVFTYSVAANTSTTSRTGTITIGGQTHTVTQQASPLPGLPDYGFAALETAAGENVLR